MSTLSKAAAYRHIALLIQADMKNWPAETTSETREEVARVRDTMLRASDAIRESLHPRADSITEAAAAEQLVAVGL